MLGTKTLPSKVDPLGFWDRFREQVESRIRECNAVSGEVLWKTSSSVIPAIRLSIEHAYCRGDRFDFAFDPADRVLTLIPGPEIGMEPSRLQWIGGKPDILCRGDEEITLSDALTLLLDRLVWPD